MSEFGECDDCMFMERPMNTSQSQPRDGKEGWCKRYAPRPLIGGTGTGWSDFEWPSVNTDDGCGEWVAEYSYTHAPAPNEI